MAAARPPAESPRAGGPGDHGLPRHVRIRSGRDIRSVMKRGKREKTRELDIFFAASPESFPRLGLVVPKYGHNSVERNRVKRRLREVGRVDILPRLRARDQNLDVLIRARPRAYDAPYATLKDTLVSWVEAEPCAAS